MNVELIVHLKIAKSLAINIPMSLLGRAESVDPISVLFGGCMSLLMAPRGHARAIDHCPLLGVKPTF